MILNLFPLIVASTVSKKTHLKKLKLQVKRTLLTTSS